MATGRTCGKCVHFSKINWNDNPRDHLHCFGRNGICDKYDYNLRSSATFAAKCQGYKGKRYKRPPKKLLTPPQQE